MAEIQPPSSVNWRPIQPQEWGELAKWAPHKHQPIKTQDFNYQSFIKFLSNSFNWMPFSVAFSPSSLVPFHLISFHLQALITSSIKTTQIYLVLHRIGGRIQQLCLFLWLGSYLGFSFLLFKLMICCVYMSC